MTSHFTYAIIGGGVDLDGWYKVRLMRSDGREIKVAKKRVAELRRTGRITNQSQTPGREFDKGV